MTIARNAILTILLVLIGNDAHAWNGLEHQRIGALAYENACRAIIDEYGYKRPDMADRLIIACRGVLNVKYGYEYAPLFGEWSAIAGDHTENPEQLVSAKLGAVVVNYAKLTKLAITNDNHFHPVCVTAWRGHHARAVTAAAAISGNNVAAISSFEAALAEEAFAQHYLQDSFAAGHMGFNRVASSNAASLLYHNLASRYGRCVANLKNEAWFTYGDGYLDYGESEGHVVAAATASIEDVIRAFVTRHVEELGWEAPWLELPAYYKPQVMGGAQLGCKLDSTYASLRNVNLPVEPAYTIELQWVRDGTAYYGPPVMQGFILGGSTDIGAIRLGYRDIQGRFFGGIGESVYGLGKHSLLVDTEYLLRVAKTTHGTLTHELGIGFAWFWSKRYSFESFSERVIYAVNVETGFYYVRLQTAYGWGYHDEGYRISSGFRVTVGVGRVIGLRR